MTPPELRPYQTDIIARIETEIAAGRRRICLVAATVRAGTVIAAAVINKVVARREHVVFVGHRRELTERDFPEAA